MNGDFLENSEFRSYPLPNPKLSRCFSKVFLLCPIGSDGQIWPKTLDFVGMPWDEATFDKVIVATGMYVNLELL